MTALTQNKPRTYSGTPQRNGAPLAAATRVYEGEAIGMNAADGTARSLVTGDRFLGFAAAAASSVGNPTGAAAVQVPLVSAGEVELAVSGVTVADVGSSVFATDGDAFALSGSSLVGNIVRVPVAGTAVVSFDLARPALSAAQTAALAVGNLADLDGSVFALSEAVAVQTLTATGTAFSGACEFRGIVVRAISGTPQTVAVYDATSETGTPIATFTVSAAGTYYWDGDWTTAGNGNGGRRVNSTGCHVVISGGTSRTIDVMVE